MTYSDSYQGAYPGHSSSRRPYSQGSERYAPAPERRPRRDAVVVRLARAFGGALAAGVFVLTAVVVGSAILGQDRGFPGPGTESVVAHVLASVVVLGAALFADRRTGLRAFGASLLVPVVLAVLLWTQWWG